MNIKKNKRIIILIIALFLTLAVIFSISQRKQEFKGVTENFNVDLPIEILYAEPYEDGGTISVAIKDAKGDVFYFSLDGRIETTWDGQLRYFYMEPYPTEDDLRIPYAGEKEQELLTILKSWDSSDWEPVDKFDHSKEIIEHVIELLEERNF